MNRTAEIRRNTKETRICVTLNLDGSGGGLPSYDRGYRHCTWKGN